jgi:hypothetical protein
MSYEVCGGRVGRCRSCREEVISFLIASSYGCLHVLPSWWRCIRKMWIQEGYFFKQSQNTAIRKDWRMCFCIKSIRSRTNEYNQLTEIVETSVSTCILLFFLRVMMRWEDRIWGFLKLRGFLYFLWNVYTFDFSHKPSHLPYVLLNKIRILSFLLITTWCVQLHPSCVSVLLLTSTFHLPYILRIWSFLRKYKQVV